MKNRKLPGRVESAAWSASRFIEIYSRLKELNEQGLQNTPGTEEINKMGWRMLRRETGILLRRLFWLWLFFPHEEAKR
jgi:hypothetical protein